MSPRSSPERRADRMGGDRLRRLDAPKERAQRLSCAYRGMPGRLHLLVWARRARNAAHLRHHHAAGAVDGGRGGARARRRLLRQPANSAARRRQSPKRRRPSWRATFRRLPVAGTGRRDSTGWRSTSMRCSIASIADAPLQGVSQCRPYLKTPLPGCATAASGAAQRPDGRGNIRTALNSTMRNPDNDFPYLRCAADDRTRRGGRGGRYMPTFDAAERPAASASLYEPVGSRKGSARGRAPGPAIVRGKIAIESAGRSPTWSIMRSNMRPRRLPARMRRPRTLQFTCRHRWRPCGVTVVRRRPGFRTRPRPCASSASCGWSRARSLPGSGPGSRPRFGRAHLHHGELRLEDKPGAQGHDHPAARGSAGIGRNHVGTD